MKGIWPQYTTLGLVHYAIHQPAHKFLRQCVFECYMLQHCRR